MRTWHVVAILAAGSAAAWVLLTPTPEQRLLAACDSAIRARIDVPSSYRREKHAPMQVRPATLDDFMGWAQDRTLREEDQREIESGSQAGAALVALRDVFAAGRWRVAEISIVYSFQGSRGSQPGVATCTHVAQADDEYLSGRRGIDVRIDGRTEMQDLTRKIRALSGT